MESDPHEHGEQSGIARNLETEFDELLDRDCCDACDSSHSEPETRIVDRFFAKTPPHFAAGDHDQGCDSRNADHTCFCGQLEVVAMRFFPIVDRIATLIQSHRRAECVEADTDDWKLPSKTNRILPGPYT